MPRPWGGCSVRGRILQSGGWPRRVRDNPMDIKSTWKGLVARRGSDGVIEAPPSERRGMKNELAEIQEMRARIAKVAEARKVHASVVTEKDASAQVLNEVLGESAALRSKIAAREREIA